MIELPENIRTTRAWEEGIALLNRPVWPLCHLISLLYLTGPYSKFEQLLNDLPSPLETASGLTYPEPADILSSHIDLLRPMEMMKGAPGAKKNEAGNCLDRDGKHVDPWECSMAQVQQRVLERELEVINSLLCGPCRCTLCCTGPTGDAVQEFFEIPLIPDEIDLFALPRIGTDRAGDFLPDDDRELEIEGIPFYRRPPCLYHWKKGWSLILPRDTSCPNLRPDGGCGIYQDRPSVCRKPQIFPLVLSKIPPDEKRIKHDAILAVWDCPYVRELKEDILSYASKSGLQVIFKENKA